MLSRKEIYQSAKNILRQRRNNALDTADRHKKEVYSRDDRFEQIDRELADIGCSAAKSVLRGSSAASVLSEMKEKSLELQKEYNLLLEKYGYCSDYLKPEYICKKCEDTGSVEINNRTVMCDCIKKIMINETCRELSRELPLKESRFDNFSLDYYDDDDTLGSKNPRKRMSRILDYCKNYAENFNRESKNLLMIGGTGLGKTHLSLAIANVVIRKGFSVIYITSSDLVAKYQQLHFQYNYSAEEELNDTLLKADLLIIDDLGTEFNTMYSSSALYNIFNSRLQRGLPVIINTNVPLSELEPIYSQRFISRIMGYCDKLDFLGSDIRQRKH